MFKNRKIIPPTPEEDAAINRGIAADPDTYELSTREIAELKPFVKRMGRPPKENPKEQVSIRYDADIVAAFRATGDGWQTRMNDALRTYMNEHPLEHA
ncbi:BrnA antitoxin family protein [Paraburkholderia phenoliruptrix]|uniref:BrnA antitoxin family protein n=1 Tax=Paraburkholderia phenoliruptrix TaxID=252970 RepID=UPI0034CF49B6